MPMAEMKKPPPQQTPATTPARRGPSFSTHRPNIAADDPRKTIASVKVHVSVLTFQSSGPDFVMPIARLSGSQKTLNPYAIPMDRWMASAAGGTSHRLKPGVAMIRSFDRSGADSALTVVVTWSPAQDGR